MTPGSVVGWPAWSTSIPGGMASPLLHAIRTLPTATRLVAMSTMTGSWREVPGMPKEIGLVAKRPRLPR